jgi:NAD(P)-dependent dehydrogenase (short-subunit alcohol dehydrogenase family)
MAVESLAGKVAIVSGSSRGIGAATCVELASRQVFDLPRVRNSKEERLLNCSQGCNRRGELSLALGTTRGRGSSSQDLPDQVIIRI